MTRGDNYASESTDNFAALHTGDTPSSTRQKLVSETSCVRRSVSVSSFTVPGMSGGGVRGYRLGYARVSTLEQDPQLQLHALAAAGVDEVFVDHASGALAERP